MKLDLIPAGIKPPYDLNAIIEIPAWAPPVKYEFDKKSGALHVDRFMPVSMVYPANYGFIPHTLGGDGDPLDVLVLTEFPLIGGSVCRCRPLGLLNMEDEKGQDEKIIAVPHAGLTKKYDTLKSIEDLEADAKARLVHFFEHYKDLDAGKWVKVTDWHGAEKAAELIQKSLQTQP